MSAKPCSALEFGVQVSWRARRVPAPPRRWGVVAAGAARSPRPFIEPPGCAHQRPGAVLRLAPARSPAMIGKYRFDDTPSIIHNPAIATARAGQKLKYAELTGREKRDFLF